MAFDITKQKVFAEKSVTVGDITLVAGIYCYNDGEIKYGEQRKFIRASGKEAISAIGRKTLVEMKALAPLTVEMMTVLEKATVTPQPTTEGTPKVF